MDGLSDDGADTGGVSDAAGDGVDGAGDVGDPVGDTDGEVGGEGSQQDGDVGGDDPAPHLNDLATAKKSYAELRNKANSDKRQLDDALARIAALEQDQYDYSDEYDDQHFESLSQRNPVEAFEYALEQGATEDAVSAVARVQHDANQMTAIAAQLRSEGDEQQAAYYENLSLAASREAARMSSDLNASQQQAAVEPLMQQQRMNQLNAAAKTVRDRHQGDTSNYAERIGEIIQSGVVSMGQGSQRELEAGFEAAYRIAKSEAPVVTDDVDAKIQAAVAAALEGQKAGRRKAAAAAGGEDGGRRDPSGDVPELSEEDVARQRMGLGKGSKPIGHAALWNM